MKDPSNIRRSTSIHGITPALVPADRAGKARRRVSVSRWRALEDEQFRALVASPKHQNGSKRGSGSY
jgi:heme-degrading monooxygenase HmoA